MIQNITLEQISIGVLFLVSLFGGLGYFLKPVKTFLKRLEKVENHQDNDNRRLGKLEEDTKQILLSVDVLMQHSIDGNHTESLKKRKDELSKYLIKR